MPLELTDPDRGRETAFLSMAQEFRAAGEHHLVDEDILLREGFPAYVDWLERGRRGAFVATGLVPWSAFWIVDHGTGALVGVCSIRHELSPWLAECGGHIGYRIRPARRREGLGTQALKLALGKAHALGIRSALVVCTADNEGSRGVIRNNQGRYERTVEADGQSLLRYWLSTAET